MTAINAFQDQDYAYIGCDSGYVNYDGTVHSFGFKMVHFSHFRVAVAVAGAGMLPAIVKAAKDDVLLGQASVLDSLEKHFLNVRKQMAVERSQFEESGLNEMTMIAACYLDEGRPVIFRLATSDKTMPGFPVNQWHELDSFHLPGDYPADTLANPYVDDPIEDGRALFRAQRHCSYPGIDGIGLTGTCSILRVGKHGVDGFDILEFADEVGKRPDPSDVGQNIERTLRIV